jgi:hypothetical protein
MRTDVFGVGMLIRVLFPEGRSWQKIAAKATQMDPKDRYPDVAALQATMAAVAAAAGGYADEAGGGSALLCVGYCRGLRVDL